MYDVDVCGRSYHSDTMQRQCGENITIQLDLNMPERTTRVTPRANKNSPVTSQSHSSRLLWTVAEGLDLK